MAPRRLYTASLFAIIALTLVALGCTRGGGAGAKPADLAAWEFPATVEAFRRSDLEGGPTSGEIVAQYETTDATMPAFVTVFVYPAPEMLHILSDREVQSAADDVLSAQHFADNKLAIEQSHSSARLISEGPTSTVQHASVQPGFLATYRLTEPFLGAVVDLDSTLHQFRDGPWVVKVRATYPTSVAAEASVAVAAFIDALAWPEAE